MFERSRATKPWYVKQYPPPIGGLNTDWSPDNIRDDQLQVLENFDIDEEGRLVSRPGQSKLNSAVV